MPTHELGPRIRCRGGPTKIGVEDFVAGSAADCPLNTSFMYVECDGKIGSMSYIFGSWN